MTTRLSKPVSRELAPVAGRPPLVVTLTLQGVQFRVKGTRTSYLLPYEVGYLRAATLAADLHRATMRRPVRAKRGLLTVGRG